MKELLITSRYSNVLLDFIQNEIINCDKELIELFLDEEIINGNSVINYAGKDILLKEYLILDLIF